jgi:lysophospholipase L1-like esterase
MRYASWIQGLLWIGSASLAVGCNYGVDPFAGDEGGLANAGDDGADDGVADGGDAAADAGDDASDAVGDSGGAGTDTGTDPTATSDGDSGDSGGPIDNCHPIPSRVIVFGDSIFACFGVGGKSSNDCSPKIIADYISATYGPVTYENLAVNGDRTIHVPEQQMPTMPVGPGHALVMIYIGGNDLAQYIFSSDQEAENQWTNSSGPEVAQKWEEIFEFLEDPANFPDGVTLLMNNQYNPFDDCTAAPYQSVTPLKTEILAEHNALLAERAAAHGIAVITDQHTPFLGHGHHFDDSSCPYYMSGASGWMFDVIHPNVAGHRNLADQMQLTVDSLYEDCE